MNGFTDKKFGYFMDDSLNLTIYLWFGSSFIVEECFTQCATFTFQTQHGQFVDLAEVESKRINWREKTGDGGVKNAPGKKENGLHEADPGVTAHGLRVG